MKKLQVGESYENRLGASYLIECYEKEGEFPFRGIYIDHNGEADYALFTEQGRFASFGCSDYDLIIPDEPQVQQPVQTEVKLEVPHLDVILAIVQKIPVQYDFLLCGHWHDFDDKTDINPVDCPEYNWRIKPKLEPKRTVQIGERTVVAPEVEAPVVGAKYHTPLGTCPMTWKNDAFDNKYLKVGRVFLTKESADSFQEALESLIFGKD